MRRSKVMRILKGLQLPMQVKFRVSNDSKFENNNRV